MSFRKRGKYKGSNRVTPTAQIDRFLGDKPRSGLEVCTDTARGEALSPTSSPGGMAASHPTTSLHLTGIPSLLNGSSSNSLATQSLGEDPDIRALLRVLPTKADMEALPTKADMEALVLRVEEQHRRDLQELCSEVHEIDERLTREETLMGALETRVSQLEKAQQRHQDQLAEVQLHAEDLENRSRRQNLRLRGIPKATGPENLTEAVRAIIHIIIDSDLPTSLEFVRIHRALGPKHADMQRPRSVLCRLHRYSHKEQIMRAVWLKGPVDFNGAQISVYPDVCRVSLLRRAMLKPLLEKLCRAELPYRWGFPIQLTIRKGSASFTLRRHAKLPNLFAFLGMEAVPLRDWLGPLPHRDLRPAPQGAPMGLPHRSARRRQREAPPIGRGEPEM